MLLNSASGGINPEAYLENLRLPAEPLAKLVETLNFQDGYARDKVNSSFPCRWRRLFDGGLSHPDDTNILTRPLPCPGVRFCPLAADRQGFFMPHAPVRTYIHQTLDVLRYFPAQIAFHAIALLKNRRDMRNLLLAQILASFGGIYPGFFQDDPGVSLSNPIKISQRHVYSFFFRKVDT